MELVAAILKSPRNMARRRATGRPTCEILARAFRLEAPLLHYVRIVASYTDPTVLRKPSVADIRSDKWEPVQ